MMLGQNDSTVILWLLLPSCYFAVRFTDITN